MPTEAPGSPLLPRLDALPTGFRWVALFLMLHAAVLLLPAIAHPSTQLPGHELPDLPGMYNIWWLVYEQGMSGAMHSKMIMYPAVTDRFTIQGFPLDALFGWPFCAAFGLTAGFTLGVWSFLGAAGISMAWLCARWWKSAIGGLAGGIAFQTAGIYLREINQGRAVHVLGAAFVPVAIALAMDATDRGGAGSRASRATAAILCGLCAAGCALAYWYWGVFLVVMLLMTAIACFPERRPLVGAIGLIIASGMVGAGGPLLYTLAQAGSHGGVNAQIFDVVAHTSRLIDLLEFRDLGSATESDGATMIRPVSGLLCLLACFAQRRRTLLPFLWLIVGFLLALGPVIQLPRLFGVDGVSLPGPFITVSMLPLLRRLWWPDRMLFVGAVGFALMVAGGASRLVARWRWTAAPVVILLLIEPWVMSTNLPMEVTDLTSARLAGVATVLGSGEGPFLELPLTNPNGFADLDFFLLQPLYQRATVNGSIEPDGEIAPAAYKVLYSSGPTADIYACEGGPAQPSTSDSAEVLSWLKTAGVNDVYIDMERANKFCAKYLDCITHLLGPGTDAGKFRTYHF